MVKGSVDIGILIVFVLFVAGLLFGLGMLAVGLASPLLARWRSSKLAQAAETLGFDFRPHNHEWTGVLAPFPLFAQLDTLWTKNLIKGVREGKEVLLFDRAVRRGRGWDNQTVVAWRLQHDRLPVFEMHPEQFLERLLRVEHIHFDDHPIFSKRYFVRGTDEQAIRTLFQPRVLEAFEASREQWIVQGQGEWLVAYRPFVIMPTSPDALRTFLDEGYNIFALFGKG
jgi:hypothetical protein